MSALTVTNIWLSAKAAHDARLTGDIDVRRIAFIFAPAKINGNSHPRAYMQHGISTIKT